MALTVVNGDTFASTAGIAKGTERVEGGSVADTTNGGQERKVFADSKGFVGAFGRSADGIQTFLELVNEAGARVYIEVNGTTITAGTSIP